MTSRSDIGLLNRHFHRSEFACQCGCGADTVDYELLVGLTMVRQYFGRRVIINSALRCLKHNRSIGSKDTSQHVLAKAADFVVDTIPSSEVADFLERKHPTHCGIGRYDTFTHFDVRKDLARWNKTLTLA